MLSFTYLVWWQFSFVMGLFLPVQLQVSLALQSGSLKWSSGLNLLHVVIIIP